MLTESSGYLAVLFIRGKFMLLSRPGRKLRLDEPWAKTAAEYFALGAPTALPAPLKTFFLCENHKLLYAPIAKCGCTTLKRLMVELSALPNSEIILQNDVHRVTDAFSTGAQLKDHDFETVRKLVQSEEYYKFAVIREPVSRIISAYTEKFLLNRLEPRNLDHTLDVFRTVRNESTPNIGNGISFRQFAEYLLASDPTRLDPHWAPQAAFLAGVDKYNDVFTMEQFNDLSARLSELTGQTIKLGKHNTSLRHEADDLAINSGRYADIVPGEMDDVSKITANDFMAPDLVVKLHDYYKEDLEIYRSSLSGARTYQPRPVSLNQVRAKSDKVTVLTTAPDIARFVSLYSKGFFGLDNNGCGQVRVIISNHSKHTLDFESLPSSALIYNIRNRSKKLKAAPQSQVIDIGPLKPFASRAIMLEFDIPKKYRKGINSLAISLRIGDSFLVEDLAPLHITSVQFAGFSGS